MRRSVTHGGRKKLTMKYTVLLMCLGLVVSCEATLPNLDSLRCSTAPGASNNPDTPISSVDSSIFGSKVKDNQYNCNQNPSICASLGVNFGCNRSLGCCDELIIGRCNKQSDCATNDKPYCDLPNNICIPCSSLPQTGNQQCKEWATVQADPLNRVLCINGLCNECNVNTDCTRPGKGFCNQVTNICGGCTSHSDCPGSNICKLDESLLATGDTLSKLGECVAMTDVTFVDNNPAKCDNAGAGGKPFCQISQAVNSGKSYIRVAGNGAVSANLYQPVTVTNSGQRVTIIGPGRDAMPYSTAQAVINGVTVSGGAQATLIDISITNNSAAPAVQCNGTATLYAQRLLISDTIVTPKGGIYASNCTKVDVQKTKITAVSGYGIFISGGSGGHRVVNSAIINGGSLAEPVGMRLSGGASGLFAFNTIASNRQGVVCDSSVAVTDSIVMANGADPQLSGSCQQARVVTSGVTLDPNYTNAMAGDPRVTSDPGNVCIDKGMPDANKTVKDDYFGAPRPQGNGYDIGFQEVR